MFRFHFSSNFYIGNFIYLINFVHKINMNTFKTFFECSHFTENTGIKDRKVIKIV